MEFFYCLIHTPEVMTPELWVLAADNQRDAIRELEAVKRRWPRLERVELYRGEQKLRVLQAADIEVEERPIRRRAMQATA